MAGGFFSRLFGGGTKKAASSRELPQYASQAPSASPADSRPAAPMPRASTQTEVRVGKTYDDMEVSGESHYRDNIAAIFFALGREEGGVTMRVAHLIPEPNNRYDRYAVRVAVDGLQVGYVPGGDSERVFRLCARAGEGNVAAVPARIWASNESGEWRARVTLAFTGSSEREKDYGADRRASEAWEAERQALQSAKQARADAKAAQRIAGSIDGQHWTLLKPSVIELKKQGRFDEALSLVTRAIDASMNEAGVSGKRPDAWPTEQAAMILRKMGAVEEELNVLEEYVRVCGDEAVPDSVTARLAKARLR